MDKSSTTLAIALTGAVTGVLGLIFNFLNTWRAFDRDRIKLKVIPKIYYPVPGGFLTVSEFNKQSLEEDKRWRTLKENAKCLCIEVVNGGLIPVTIEAVGFITDSKNTRLSIIRPLDVSGSKLPHRLEALSATTIYGSEPEEILEQIRRIKKAYCETGCGRVFYGSSPALRDLIKQYKLLNYKRIFKGR